MVFHDKIVYLSLSSRDADSSLAGSPHGPASPHHAVRPPRQNRLSPPAAVNIR